MTAKTFIARHEWDCPRTREVVPVVTKIVESAQSGKLLAGFTPLGAVLSKGRAAGDWV